VVGGPSSPSQKVAAVPVTVGATASVATTTPGSAALDTQGGLGVTPATSARSVTTSAPAGGSSGQAGGGGVVHCTYDTPAVCAAEGGITTTTVPFGLRNATPAELTAIAADVPPPAGQKIDSVQIALSDETWGVAHVAAGAGRSQEYVLIRYTNGTWAPVDSGYPTMPCYELAADVAPDLGSLMADCPS